MDIENEQINTKKTKILCFVIVVLFVLIACVIVFFIMINGRYVKNDDLISLRLKQRRASANDYEFIKPLLTCEQSESDQNRGYRKLKEEINKVIKNSLDKKLAENISVYFDDRTGHWLEINGDEKYYPASMLKVPVAIAFILQTESNPELLLKQQIFDKKNNYNEPETYISKNQMEDGKSYTNEELMERMLKYSDNNALELILKEVNQGVLNDVFIDLGIVPPNQEIAGKDFMTVYDYSYYYRVLHNSTYLNRNNSEKLLKLLTETDFNKGIVAGVPESIKVAHKFGEASIIDQDVRKPIKNQLHDCGIVYYSQKNYLLCVVTKGAVFSELETVIKNISATVYKYMSMNIKEN